MVRSVLMAACVLLPCAARADARAPDFVAEALAKSIDYPRAKVVVDRYAASLPAGCVATTAIVTAPPEASGGAALKLLGTSSDGTPCEGWAHVITSIAAPMLVTTRTIPMGSKLAGAVALIERPWRPAIHPLAEIPEGAVATEAIPAGTTLDARHVREAGPGLGDTVTVVLSAGSISISENGQLTHCVEGRACATLPSGKRVEGRLVGDQLLVEIP
jgi:hypothetical protein